MSLAASPVEQTYCYLTPSTVERRSTATTLSLATSGGCDTNPYLASGFVDESVEAARALIVVGEVAATRFWMPPNMVAASIQAADPVVTTHHAGIRFESFSLCGGVYARLDLDATSFDGAILRHGTTNIDMGRDLKRALTQIGSRDPLKLTIGTDAITTTTLISHVIEKKIPLPERWVRGFANTALATSNLSAQFTVKGSGFRRFLHTLPTGRNENLRVVPSGPSMRLSSRPQSAAVSACGIERIKAFRPALPYLKSVTAYGPEANSGEGVSAWVADLDCGQLTIAVSPAPSRGFSGEGAWLLCQAGQAAELSHHVKQATAGCRGFDLSRQSWFQRDLPFERRRLIPTARRLTDAKQLAEQGAVTIDYPQASVRNGNAEYAVNLRDQTCTCPWWGKHRGSRGPCKHVLAGILAKAEEERARR